MTPGLIKQMEKQLVKNPCDLELRFSLLKHYFDCPWNSLRSNLTSLTKGYWVCAEAKKHRDHALWLIRNASTSEITGSFYMRFQPDSDPVGGRIAKKIWLSLIQNDPTEIRLIRNALEVLRNLPEHYEFLEEIAMSAKGLEPMNLEWDYHLLRLRNHESKKRRDIILVDIAKWKWKAQLSLNKGSSEMAALAQEFQTKYERELRELDIGLSNES